MPLEVTGQVDQRPLPIAAVEGAGKEGDFRARIVEACAAA
jgi:hypothetical protein